MEFIYQVIKFIKRWSPYLSLSGNDKQNIENTFHQLVRDKNYDEAEKLAQQHTYLDLDFVYESRWDNSHIITVQSINNVLGKIQDKLWAINQCVYTVPDSYGACKTLIEFGLKEANLRLLYQLGNEDPFNMSPRSGNKKYKKGINREQQSEEKQPLLADDVTDDEIEGLIDFSSLNDRQKELCQCRQALLHFEHALFAYEQILGKDRTINFDNLFYEEFRLKCPLEACIEDYAHDGDAHAVEVLLNFYTDSLAPHLLAILSNLPETFSPSQPQYFKILPHIIKDDVVYRWQRYSDEIVRMDYSDWSYQGVANSPFLLNLKSNSEKFEQKFYQENSHLKKYLQPLTSELLTQWYKERALELESRTLICSNAIQLLKVGSDLHIKNLKETEVDLSEFQEIVHDCCSDCPTEDDPRFYLSFAEFNQKSEPDKLILMTGDSDKNCKFRFGNFVIPYLRKHDSNLSLDEKASLLQEYFRKLANTREQVCRTIYNDLLDKIGCDNFVTEWTKDVLAGIAVQTFESNQYEDCYETCKLIMEKDYKECWAHCCNLAMCKQFQDVEAKYKLLAFALAHCDDLDGKTSTKILDYIIELRKRDERIHLAYLQLNM